jgi:hypothetical protein
MIVRKQELDKYLVKIAENLDISETMRNKAISSYQAIGKWLGGGERMSDVVIAPQGSFALGTVIKPVDDRDEYDIDLVCLLKDKHGAESSVIKQLVGNRLKEHGKYREMLQTEGKRCWTLNYDEFHMDILPCVPKALLYMEPGCTEIRLTHKIASGSYIPKYSNPYRYHRWFEGRMRDVLHAARTAYAKSNQVEIERVPLYAVKTPLQRVVQLLKRHRDVMYSSASATNKTHAPISIIITTLAALSYNNETNVIEALDNILGNMPKHISFNANKYWIANPVMPEENFADKWNEVPEKHIEFNRWLKKAKEELVAQPLAQSGLDVIAESYKKSLGNTVTTRAFAAVANNMKISREAGSLLVVGATKHITTQDSGGAKIIKEHTFFGQ